MKIMFGKNGFLLCLKKLSVLRCLFIAVAAFLSGSHPAYGQGAITFDARANFAGTNYYELGMRFRVEIPTPGPRYDSMAVVRAITFPSNVPYNTTPYMVFFRQLSPDDYVSLTLTNGNSFGLSSVNLADPSSPSLSPLAITFNGVKEGGSLVSVTFTTPGNGATNFQNYLFNSDFASGLVSMDIQASRWAMDNLVVIPEPGTVALLGLGLLVVAARRFNQRRKL